MGELAATTNNMRQFSYSLFFLMLTCIASAQSPAIDSLKSILRYSQRDTIRVAALWRLAEQYQFFKPDTTLQLAHEALLLSQRIHYIEGESRSLALMATGQYLLGDYPKALNNYMLKLQLEEKRNSSRNYASALNNIGLMYILLAQYPNALNYLRRADSTVTAAGGKTKAELENRILVNLGEAFFRMKRNDSANYFFSKALMQGRINGDDFYRGAALLGLGNVDAATGDGEAAMGNYRQAFVFLNNGVDNDMLCETAMGLANVFKKSGQPDSALHYAMLAFNTGERDGFLSREFDAAAFLSRYYKDLGNFDSAFSYLEHAVVLEDSLKGQAKTREAMIISSNEQLRQAELAEEKEKEKASRLQQLQILAICIFIPLFFLLTLAISRIRIHRNAIRFMGVVSLLLVFEFLTLLLHPLIEEYTHHNNVLLLLILVVIGAGLIPLHHKLEHLLIEKLTTHRHPKHKLPSLNTATEDIPAEPQLATVQPLMNEPLIEVETGDESQDGTEEEKKETAPAVSAEEAGVEEKEIKNLE
jgi:tetratricopeptide (TPR) repeat protein